MMMFLDVVVDGLGMRGFTNVFSGSLQFFLEVLRLTLRRALDMRVLKFWEY